MWTVFSCRLRALHNADHVEFSWQFAHFKAKTDLETETWIAWENLDRIWNSTTTQLYSPCLDPALGLTHVLLLAITTGAGEAMCHHWEPWVKGVHLGQSWCSSLCLMKAETCQAGAKTPITRESQPSRGTALRNSHSQHITASATGTRAIRVTSLWRLQSEIVIITPSEKQGITQGASLAPLL